MKHDAYLQWCESPIPWSKYGLTVLADGYDTEGNRVHVVRESGYAGKIIANAFIFSEDLLEQFSHLHFEDNENV